MTSFGATGDHQVGITDTVFPSSLCNTSGGFPFRTAPVESEQALGGAAARTGPTTFSMQVKSERLGVSVGFTRVHGPSHLATLATLAGGTVQKLHRNLFRNAFHHRLIIYGLSLRFTTIRIKNRCFSVSPAVFRRFSIALLAPASFSEVRYNYNL